MNASAKHKLNVGFIIFGLGGFFSAFTTFVNLQADVRYIKSKVDELSLRSNDVLKHEEQIKQLQRDIAKFQ